jgi:phage terminase small subunit
MHTNQDLNEMQKSFCDKVVAGIRPRDAYLEVYGCQERTASACASRLLAKANIQNRVNRLRQVSESNSVLSRLEKLELLTSMALRDGRYDDASCGDAARAIKIANEMQGHEAPVRVEALLGITIADLLAGGSDGADSWADCLDAEEPADVGD